MHIWIFCNAWSTQSRHILVCRTWAHEELDCVVIFFPRMIQFVFKCTETACRMPLLWRIPDGRESNCVQFFWGTGLFSCSSGRFKGRRVVYCEEGRTSWCLDTLSPDVVDPCSYICISVASCEHGVMKITR